LEIEGGVHDRSNAMEMTSISIDRSLEYLAMLAQRVERGEIAS
jgi:hypothetical protein